MDTGDIPQGPPQPPQGKIIPDAENGDQLWSHALGGPTPATHEVVGVWPDIMETACL